ncbi:MAG: flagellar motor protein MotB [Lachnospiraceae bacterium]|jgi:chemotaxis protein MotB|nr:flagellar motor protein MotB [Lachnospiraceae bacterium]MCI9601243.1 flagellar motor protein MotB [Lachnospiraceae bacterium]
MSRRKKGGGGEDCGSWMDTYGDMVTLLLCFFVMLYSMSSLDQQKWEVFVKSIFPSSGDTEQIAINQDISEAEYDVSGNMEFDESVSDPENPEELYIALMEALSSSGIEGVSISREDGYTFLVFENQAFFEGDKSDLTSEAVMILDILCNVVQQYEASIAQINIMGHTAQARADRANNARTDRVLSAMRSAEVAAYIQNKNIIDPSKLVGLSYGQYRSVSENDTSEGRAKNRRVEFLIIDSDADIKSMNDYYDELTNSINAGSVLVTGEEAFDTVGATSEGAASTVPEEEINPSDDSAEPAEDAAGDTASE